MKAGVEKRAGGGKVPKEIYAGGRRERVGEEIMFPEGERDDDRLKRGRENKMVNRRSRTPKKTIAEI